MPAAGLIEMPPVSKHTPLPIKATGASPFLPPFQRMITTRLSRSDPCPTPSSARMPSFAERFSSKISTPTPALRKSRAAREFLGIEHIRRLVDEIARDGDALGDRLALGKYFARRRDVADADADRHLDALGALLPVLGLGLVAGEIISPQQHAKTEIAAASGLKGAIGGLGQNRDLGFTSRHPAHDRSAELYRVLSLSARRPCRSRRRSAGRS